MWTRRTPLAWLNLVHGKARLLTAVAGVALAVVIMFIQVGFLNGLYDTQTRLVRLMNADLVLVSKRQEALLPPRPFPRRRLVQARGRAGVRAACALYVEEYRVAWKSTWGREHRYVVCGFDPADAAFLIPEVARQADALRRPDTALLDADSKGAENAWAPGATAELSGHRLRVVGTFILGPDLRADGTALVSDRTFFKCFPDRGRGPAPSRVTFGLLRLEPGADPVAVRDALRRDLPGDVRVLTRQELADLVRDYWATNQPIGYVFGLGTLVGFAIGVVICYQVLYTAVVERYPQYATLKAIGYGNGFLARVVLQEALYLALLGFVPGLLASAAVYAGLEAVSGLVLRLTPARVALLLAFTCAMCGASGALAVRKLLRSDPAEVF
jgi:putative ABC transport system permease protein